MSYLTPTQSRLLRSCSWATIRFNSSQTSSQTSSVSNIEPIPFLVKHYFTSTSYIILVTDFKCVWFEHADKEQICIKDSQLGSGFEPEDNEQLGHLLEELKEMFSAQVTSTTYLYQKNEDNRLDLSVSKSFGVATIRWKVECTLLPSRSPIAEKDLVDTTSILYDHITIPLLSAAMILQAEANYSRDIITAKEREILEATELLEAKGVTDESRKKKTKPFSFQTMKDELKKTGNPALDISLKPAALASKMAAFVGIQTHVPQQPTYDSSAEEAVYGDGSERFEQNVSHEMNDSQAIATDEPKPIKYSKPKKRMQSPELEKALQKRKDLRDELAKKQEESNKKPRKKKLF